MVRIMYGGGHGAACRTGKAPDGGCASCRLVTLGPLTLN
jgi:hypothetical protein